MLAVGIIVAPHERRLTVSDEQHCLSRGGASGIVERRSQLTARRAHGFHGIRSTRRDEATHLGLDRRNVRTGCKIQADVGLASPCRCRVYSADTAAARRKTGHADSIVG